MEQPEWLARVRDEHEQLTVKVKALTAFMASDRMSTVDGVQARLLRIQHVAMTTYLVVLDERLLYARGI